MVETTYITRQGATVFKDGDSLWEHKTVQESNFFCKKERNEDEKIEEK
jgi:hypothetical protein